MQQIFNQLLQFVQQGVSAIFKFIQERGHLEDGEAYGNLNMGAGFALYVPEGDVAAVLEIARAYPFAAMKAGYIEESTERQVVIRPKNLDFSSSSLAVR